MNLIFGGVTPGALLRLSLCLFGLASALGVARAADAPPAPAPPADAASYRRLAGEVETNLQTQVLAQWFPRALDPAGGFYQNYGEDFTAAAVPRRTAH